MIKRLSKNLLIFFLVLALCSLLGVVFILLSFGLGWLLRLFLPLSPFEATLLAMVAYITMGIIFILILRPSPLNPPDDQWYDDEMDEEEAEDDETDDEPVVVYLQRPKRNWMRSAGKQEIPVVAPDARCPCGSGRKYKNCHGRTKTVKAKE